MNLKVALFLIALAAIAAAVLVRWRRPERDNPQAAWSSRKSLRVISAITIAGGAWLLFLGMWPGMALGDGCLVLVSLPGIPLLGIAWLVVCLRRLPEPWGRGDELPLKQVAVAPVAACLTLAILLTGIPLRAAFACTQWRLTRHTNSATEQRSRLGWIVPYHIDEYARDRRGGVYFRTGTSPDGISPDTFSHGFAYQPNQQGTPFGKAHHSLRRLWGDWHEFSASDDFQ